MTDRSWHVQMEGSLLAYEWPTCTGSLSVRDIYGGVCLYDAQLPRFMQIRRFNWPPPAISVHYVK